MQPSPSSFNPTRWTIVSQARGDDASAQVALSDLCNAYYEPIISFLIREGRSQDVAQDLAHDFFAKLLSSGIGKPDQSKGRFRNYLLGALKHFILNQRVAQSAQKRGNSIDHVSLSLTDDDGDSIELAVIKDDEQSTAHFDRVWALHILQRALSQLEQEYEKKPLVFQILKPWLDGSATKSQAETAEILNMSATAMKVTLHRLRKRFRDLVRSEILQTIDDPADLEEELGYLITIIAKKNST